jgi:hypothetical protein
MVVTGGDHARAARCREPVGPSLLMSECAAPKTHYRWQEPAQTLRQVGYSKWQSHGIFACMPVGRPCPARDR